MARARAPVLVILTLTAPAAGALHMKKYSMHAAQLVFMRRWVVAFD
jgi:hypothetical protein